MGIKKIFPQDVFRLASETRGTLLIDVREPDEFAEVCSPLSENHPLSDFSADVFAKKIDKASTVYLICRSGKRSLKVAEILESAGFQNLYNVEGGMLAWESAGLPVLRKT